MATQVKESKQASHWMKWDRVVKVSCKGNCSYQKPCILNAYIKDEKIVHMEQSDTHPYNNDPNFPDWNPRGCQKGLVSGLSRTYGAHRLLHPLKRAGERGSGKFDQISWDQAITEIADTFLDVLTDEGANSIVRNFGSGTLSGNESRALNAIFNTLGISSPAEIPARGDEHQGTAVVFGQPYVGGSVDNWWYADMVIIWGGNPTYTNIPNFHLLTEARYNGTQIVTVSPDYSPSSVHSDLWIPVALGSDAALALAIAQVIIEEKLYKEDFIREQTDMPFLVRRDTGKFLTEAHMKPNGRDDAFYMWDTKPNQIVDAPRKSLSLGDILPALEGTYQATTMDGPVQVQPVFELLKEHVKGYTPEKASKITTTAPSLIRKFARDFAKAGTVTSLSTFNWGKYYNGNEIERAIHLIFGLCGHWGKRGSMCNGFTGLSADAIAGADVGDRETVHKFIASDPRYKEWKEDGWTDTMVVMQHAREAWVDGKEYSQVLMHYIHGGLLELSEKSNSWDPNLRRKVSEYLQESIDKGWQTLYPDPNKGKEPRIMWGVGSWLRSDTKGTDTVINTLLPKLKMMVHTDYRWTGTALYADYVLPAAGWYEKASWNPAFKTDYPYGFVNNKAVEPQGDSKTEFQIACMLAKKLEDRAKARGIETVIGGDGKPKDPSILYAAVTKNGKLSPDNLEGNARDAYENTRNREDIPWEKAKEIGLIAATYLPLSARGIGNACDITPHEPIVPLTWHTDKKEPYPTQTRRMQFYVDHDWYFEFGVALPGHRDNAVPGGDYPLGITGGHARHSVHSNHAEDPTLLRLQRGEPVMFVAKQDADARGIEDGDMVEAYNDVASFQVKTTVSGSVRPGQVIIYHSWENFQFKNWTHFQTVMPSALDPLDLAGGHHHISAKSDVFHPGFNDRGTRVELRKVDGK